MILEFGALRKNKKAEPLVFIFTFLLLFDTSIGTKDFFLYLILNVSFPNIDIQDFYLVSHKSTLKLFYIVLHINLMPKSFYCVHRKLFDTGTEYAT